MTQQTTDWMADLMLDRVEIVPGVSAAVVVVVVAPEAVGRISRLGLCSPVRSCVYSGGNFWAKYFLLVYLF